MKWLCCACGAAALLLGAANVSPAVEPATVYVLVNKNVAESQQVAEHYCKLRGVPRENVVSLDLPKGEDISRADYDKLLVEPLRAALKDRKDKVKVLLSVYGVPLRVGRSSPSEADKEQLAKLAPELNKARAAQKEFDAETKRVQEAAAKDEDKEAKAKWDAAIKKRQQQGDGFKTRVQALEQSQRFLNHAESEASIDSELMLLWWPKYETRRWQVNPLYFQVPEEQQKKKPPVLMVSRLDGPSAAVAMRLVDDAVAVEKKGLEGKVYVDARGIAWNPKTDGGYGYGGYDESLREMARLLKDDGKFDVTLDDKGPLFAPGSCPDAALYCGWYSLANYVGCCKFVKGAVAYHIASSEAVSLRNAKAKYWCKNLLDNGVAATLGPVAEPYTIGFPKPAEFFGLLLTGKYTLVECYSRTTYFASWMTVLVGDPLYNPFGKAPRLTPEQVRPSPQGSKFLMQVGQ